MVSRSQWQTGWWQRHSIHKAESSRKIKQNHKRKENPKKPKKREIVDRGSPIMRALALNLSLEQSYYLLGTEPLPLKALFF